VARGGVATSDVDPLEDIDYHPTGHMGILTVEGEDHYELYQEEEEMGGGGRREEEEKEGGRGVRHGVESSVTMGGSLNHHYLPTYLPTYHHHYYYYFYYYCYYHYF